MMSGSLRAWSLPGLLGFVLASPLAAQSEPAMARVDGSRVEPARYEYRQRISLLGQTVELTSFRSVEAGSHQGQPVWTVVEETRTPEGTALDSTYTDPATLVPIRRVVLQGDQRVELDFGPDAARGRYTGAESVSIDIPLDGPVLDGGALVVAIRTLPLEAGYAATLRTISLQEQAVVPLPLAVEGAETVAVPAGTFDAWKVRLEPPSGGASTLWVERAPPHRVVRTESEMAVGGAGVVVSELMRD